MCEANRFLLHTSTIQPWRNPCQTKTGSNFFGGRKLKTRFNTEFKCLSFGTLFCLQKISGQFIIDYKLPDTRNPGRADRPSADEIAMLRRVLLA